MNRMQSPARRLAWFLALSGCMHLLALVPALPTREADVARGATQPLAVRLARPPSAAAARAPQSRPTLPPAAAPVVAPAARANQAAKPAPAPASTASVQSASLPGAPDTGAIDVATPAGLARPPDYAVSRPAPNTLVYEVQTDNGPVSEDTASLALQYTPSSYSLRITGAADSGGNWDAHHVLTSEGVLTDGAFAPLRAGAGRDGLPAARIRLNRAHDPLGASEAPADAMLLQDRASLLLQLIGIGLHNPAQLETPVQIPVAGPDGVAIAVFQLAGIAQIGVPLGNFEAWHLVLQTEPGQAGLEVWLAPALGWYPVQIKTTAPEGAVVVQRLLRAASH